jgi:hypothetical protein
MKRSTLIRLGEDILCDFERLNGGKALDAGLLEGVSQDWFLNLLVSSVSAVNRVEWDQFSRVGR